MNLCHSEGEECLKNIYLGIQKFPHIKDLGHVMWKLHNYMVFNEFLKKNYMVFNSLDLNWYIVNPEAQVIYVPT